MAYTVIGRIRPRPMGAWNAETEYETLDVAMQPDGAGAFMAIQNVPAGTELSNSGYWLPVVDINAAVDAAKAATALANQAAAEVKDDVEQLKGDLVNLNLIADESDFTIINNKYCDSGDLVIYDANGYSVTEPYLLEKGSKLVLEANGLDTNVSMISLCDSENTERVCLIRSIDSSKRTYTYIAPTDMYVCLSFGMSGYSIKIYKENYIIDDSIYNAIRTNNNPLLVGTVRKMIYNNSYEYHTNYCCSAPILLKKGQTIKATMRCESVVNAISISNSDGTIISCVKKGIGNTVSTYEYSANKDCYVVLCFYVSTGYNNNFNAIVYYPVYNKIENTLDDMSFSMFETWGIIGDSFASGVFYDSNTSALNNHLQKSWCQILARKSGNNCVNFSMGGLYCATWLTNDDRGLPYLLRESAKELYVIALGINDTGRIGGVQPVGTIADINDDFTQNPNTFYGNYGKIIGNIKSHAPKAKIIMSTIPYNGNDAMIINNAIIAIAQHFGLPCLMVHEDKFFRSDYYWNNFEQDHPKSFMYGATANAYERLICDSLKNDTSYWGDTFN